MKTIEDTLLPVAMGPIYLPFMSLYRIYWSIDTCTKPEMDSLKTMLLHLKGAANMGKAIHT